MSGDTTTDLRSDFIERMGLIAQGEGMPRSAGRMLALLIWDGEPIAFADLAATLQISRGNVSTSARLLEERGLVRRVSRPAERQDFFQIAPNAFLSMLNGTRVRIENAMGEIEKVLETLPAREQGPRTRLTEYAEFYRAIADGLQTAVDRLQSPGR
ncbi:GbsR/MarR family transcriptional regulator [Wenxinia marina]|uniref:Putative transcriptional regulator n=1 Tax=Wenxinia marina DSM 24838 TaxID=1123501 RepID=A0A0D0Q418_9RHOB|nr:MarR family transcriptional regulator [Wenxinia marina]KIQ69244.1 putative transcriptional regulator [Wenxinia marina DSM 24838]GGL71414.1 hypothetical protein GCM10011392_27530 [Wenxinia marina]